MPYRILYGFISPRIAFFQLEMRKKGGMNICQTLYDFLNGHFCNILLKKGDGLCYKKTVICKPGAAFETSETRKTVLLR